MQSGNSRLADKLALAPTDFRIRMDQALKKDKALVTGATGFLGQAVTKDLIAIGYEVRAVGRNQEKGQHLQSVGAEFCPVDIRDAFAINRALHGIDLVIHCAAVASPWGSKKEFQSTNVEGTRNIINSCLDNSVRRMVYVSTPSVVSRFRHQLKLNENMPAPKSFVSEYARTKWLAEEEVRKISTRDLETVILRPKSIYAPGDNNIFPRIINAARIGRLPMIGDGSALTNITHLSDAVTGVRLALESQEAVGHTYFVTGGEEVRSWDVICRVLEGLSYPTPRKAINLSLAMKLAGTLEWVWKTFRLPEEPPLTRYAVGLLGFSQTLDIGSAKRDLGYRPVRSAREGIEELIYWHIYWHKHGLTNGNLRDKRSSR